VGGRSASTARVNKSVGGATEKKKRKKEKREANLKIIYSYKFVLQRKKKGRITEGKAGRRNLSYRGLQQRSERESGEKGRNSMRLTQGAGKDGRRRGDNE